MSKVLLHTPPDRSFFPRLPSITPNLEALYGLSAARSVEDPFSFGHAGSQVLMKPDSNRVFR